MSYRKTYTLPDGSVTEHLPAELSARYRYNVSTDIIDRAIGDVINSTFADIEVNIDKNGWIDVRLNANNHSKAADRN